MNDTERHLIKLATDHYDLAVEHGRFTPEEVADSLLNDLLGRYEDDQGITRQLLSMTARSLVERIDKARTRSNPDAPTLLDDLDSPIKISKGQRVARRYMLADDWSAHLQHISENVTRVNTAAAREHARFTALSPYLAQGMTTESACESWQADNADEVLP